MNSQFDILLVEDEQVVIDATRRTLLPEGFSVDEAPDVASALQRLQQNSYKLILCDLMLPNVSGIELVEKVKRELPNVPVIMVTGYATLENAIRSFKVGAFDFMPKPFDIEELLGVVYRGINHFEALQDLATRTKPDASTASLDRDKRYFLGEHSWAKLDRDGVCVCGVGETFPYRMGEIQRVEFSSVNAEVLQGNACVKIISQEDLVNKVWAPVSGKVVATNSRIEQDVNLIDADPYGLGWLVKIMPTNLRSELENLQFR